MDVGDLNGCDEVIEAMDRQAILRRMDYFDLDRVYFIESQSFPNPWPRSAFVHAMMAGYECWVLESESLIVGYGILDVPLHHDGHLLNLCIADGQRRKGLGRRLLAHLLSLAESRAPAVFLEVRASNREARRLYQRMGFQLSGIRKDYYPSPGGCEDALVFRRVIREQVGISGKGEI